MRFTLLRIICNNTVLVFFHSAKRTKNQTAGYALLYAHMYVCSYVRDRMHDKDSETIARPSWGHQMFVAKITNMPPLYL